MFKPLMMTALLFTSATALAGEKPVAPSIKVVTADLDLTTAIGRKMLDRRIRAAVDQVCPDADKAPRVGILKNDRCRQLASVSVRNQRSAVLLAANARKNGKTGIELASATAK